MQKKYILIDGSGYVFRAFYALPPISRSDKLPVGAVYGFVNMLLKLLNERNRNDEIIVVIFDKARKNFRNEIYPEYKANRDETPVELVPQFAYIRKAVEAFGLPSIEQAGFEADDLIATYATQIANNGDTAIIYSSDKDLMQLLRPNISLFDPLKQRVVDANVVVQKFGVSPDKVIDIQALVGDTSDNIPGVRGIGPKTAAELINKYGSLEELLNNARNIPQDKRREMIETGAEMARISKILATLKNDVPLDVPLSSIQKTTLDKVRLLSFLDEMEFKSLKSKIENIGKNTTVNEVSVENTPVIVPTIPSPQIKNIEKNYQLITDEGDLDKWISMCQTKGIFAIDTETTGINSLVADIVGISLAVEEGVAAYIPITHKKVVFGGVDLFNDNSDILLDGQLSLDLIVQKIRGLLLNPDIKKIGHNIKYDLHVLNKIGLNVVGIEDTMVMSYDLTSTSNAHNMDELANLYLGYKTIAFKDICGTGKSQITFDYVPIEKAVNYAAEDADITLRLYNIFDKQLNENPELLKVYREVDLPLVNILFKMEERGIKIDDDALLILSGEFDIILSTLESEIHEMAGVQFNILSPKQLGEVLFLKMGLPYSGKKSSGGDYSTDVEVLKQLSYGGFQIADKVLKYREISKLKSTYTDSLPEQVSKIDKRVHTNYFACGISSGRLSSNNPNLQNIPIRTELGKNIRMAFVAQDGFKLVAADYSQIELRVLADYAGVANLKTAFIDNVDIHTRTASQVFGIPEAEITSDIRRKAKAINFGIVYGISAFGLAKQLGISNTEAREYIDNYFSTFPEIKSYMEQEIEFAHKYGYIKTLYGRHCFINGINNPKLKSYAERLSINAPIQGTAADILKLAMIEIDKKIESENLSGEIRMLLQVHDELVFEVRDDLVDYAKSLIKSAMESVFKPSVPIIADIGVGKNWRDAH